MHPLCSENPALLLRTYQVIENCVTHAAAQNTTGDVGLVPGPVPGGKNSGQDKLSKRGDEIERPVVNVIKLFTFISNQEAK